MLCCQSPGKKAEFTTSAICLMTSDCLAGRGASKGMSFMTRPWVQALSCSKTLATIEETVNSLVSRLWLALHQQARMNIVLHGVAVGNYHLSNHDTLDEDWPATEPTDFDGVMNPPATGGNWSAEIMILGPSLSSYGVLAPKSKADLPFTHGLPPQA